jgi:hypothetical protein
MVISFSIYKSKTFIPELIKLDIKIASDISYVETEQGVHSLSLVIDAYTRENMRYELRAHLSL